MSLAGRTAIELLPEDQRLLREHGAAPVLNCFLSYPARKIRWSCPRMFTPSTPTAPRWKQTHFFARITERQAKVCATRTRYVVWTFRNPRRTAQTFGGEDNACFREFLAENCYDLHYAPAPSAQPFSFGVGNLAHRDGLAGQSCSALHPSRAR